MGRSIQATDAPGGPRVDWVDYAKGFCIVFVVMMHSTLGVENAVGREGWLHAVVAFAKPFRMPDFFLISGLFLAQVIDRDWRTYLDRKVVHFVYFYLLWTAIQFAIKAPVFVHEHGPLSTIWLYIESFWEPFSTLWFIYLLPIFFVLAKLAHNLRVPPLVVWLAAAALEIAHIHTGSTVVDEFASRFVYFYTGYLFAPRIFALAKSAQAHPGDCPRRPRGLGLDQRPAGLQRACRVAVRLARARARRSRGSGRRFGAVGQERPRRAAALLRAQLDRHLSRLLPADGRQPRGAHQDWLDHRHRHDVGDRDAGRGRRRAGLVLGGAMDVPALHVRAAGTILDRAQEAAGSAAGGVAKPQKGVDARRKTGHDARLRVADTPPKC